MTKSIQNHFYIFFVTFLTVSFYCDAQSTYKYDVEKVIDDVYLLKPNISQYRWVTSNIVVIVNESDVFVVDSGLTPSAAQAAIVEIKKITNKPVRRLVNTHWHGDHWQGNEGFYKEYPGIEIIATEQGFNGISRNGMVWARGLYQKYLQEYAAGYDKAIAEKKSDGKDLTPAEIEELKTGSAQTKQDIAEIKSMKARLPNTTFSDRMTVRAGSREIQVLYLGIGNTSGDAVVYLPKEKVLIAGDLVVSPSPFESGMFSPEWLETSQKLAAFDYQYLLPGHGDALKSHDYLNFLNALYAEIIKQITDVYLKGDLRMDEIKTKVTHQTVVDQLSKNPAYAGFCKDLGPGFVPSAVSTSYKRVIQGKQ